MSHVCRRICFLRERGDFAAAEQLEAIDLASALTRCRELHSDTEIADRLRAIFNAESARVATAVVLADYFLSPAVTATASASALAPVAPFELAPRARTEEPAPPMPLPGSRPARGTDITAFIDQMLAMPDTDEPPPHRRAS